MIRVFSPSALQKANLENQLNNSINNQRRNNMSLLRVDPFHGFESLYRKVNAIANEFEKGFNTEYSNFSPRIDIVENEKSIEISAELPGVRKEDVKLSINDDNVLMIKGSKFRQNVEKTEDGNEKEIVCLKAERNYGEFTRQFMLPDNINKESINARYDNGVLHISFEKKEPEKPKSLEIAIQ